METENTVAIIIYNFLKSEGPAVELFHSARIEYFKARERLEKLKPNTGN